VAEYPLLYYRISGSVLGAFILQYLTCSGIEGEIDI